MVRSDVQGEHDGHDFVELGASTEESHRRPQQLLEGVHTRPLRGPRYDTGGEPVRPQNRTSAIRVPILTCAACGTPRAQHVMSLREALERGLRACTVAAS